MGIDPVPGTQICVHIRIGRAHRWHIDGIDGIDGSAIEQGRHAIDVPPMAALAGKIAPPPRIAPTTETHTTDQVELHGQFGRSSRAARHGAVHKAILHFPLAAAAYLVLDGPRVAAGHNNSCWPHAAVTHETGRFHPQNRYDANQEILRRRRKPVRRLHEPVRRLHGESNGCFEDCMKIAKIARLSVRAIFG